MTDSVKYGRLRPSEIYFQNFQNILKKVLTFCFQTL